MPSASVELTNTVAANGSGLATITFQAPNVGPRGLAITSIALLVTGSTTIPQCTAYRNVVAAQNVLARKTAGDRGTFVGQDDVLYMGQQLVLVWTGATPGASCTATLRGYAVAPR
jgi:hypothetical protein